MLIGNKCDLEATRVVTIEQGEKMAAHFDMEFYETSAKLNINVDEAFFQMAQLIMESLPPPPEVIQTEGINVEDYDGSATKKRISCCYSK